MSGELLLGVDVGTTQTKIGAFDLEGRLVALSRAGYPLNTDSKTNAAEQDPNDWWAAVVSCLRRVVEQIDPMRVLAVSVGGQGPTLVALNDDLEPVCPAMTWMDLRATTEAQRLADAGFRLPPHFFMPKSMWLKENRPEAYRTTNSFCQSWDFVAMRLLGELVVSSSPGIAPWTSALIAAAGVDAEKFPATRQMGQRLGRVSAKAAQATGLPEGVAVIGGISDFFEGLIGSGALNRGLAVDNGGTSGAFSLCWDTPLQDQALLCVPSFMDGYWHVGGPVSTSGKALEWWLEGILAYGPDDYSALDEVAGIPVGSERLIFLPFLAGERAPIWDPKARGIFFGLSLTHKRAHLTRAILEAVAYTLCHVIKYLEMSGGQVLEIRSIGGQAKSDLWCQIKADASGCRVVVPEFTDAPTLGAAAIAGVGAGVFSSFPEGAKQMARVRKIIEPDRERHERYQNIFGIYQDVYLQLRPLFGRLADV
jgi:xylulokinase